MGALPRPDLPPGPHRDLVDALHRLHHEAGWPSLRTLARQAGCSHTTVSAVLSGPRLPAWGVLEVLVEAMAGEVPEFHRLWLAAGSPADRAAPAAAPIAGRKAELAAVRRHVEAGSGLLLVTGEAGIGKTRLVTSAAQGSPRHVAAGSCLPLSTAVPLLPFADALAAVHDIDEGQWFKEALADCPSYVSVSLRPLVPQLEPTGAEPTPVADDWSRQRLFGAVRSALLALSELRPLVLQVEDLHWADTATLDLLEHLVARGGPVPIVGTYRLDEAATPPGTAEWFNRVTRLPTVAALGLGPLTRDETAEQLALLRGSAPPADLVERLHRRSAGQPLFTEQLAAQAEQADRELTLPRLLADLLDRRLDGLTAPMWGLVRSLGVGDRPLTVAELSAATGLAGSGLTAELHALDQRRLLAPVPGGHHVQLRHPLLAEAVRRRLVAGEAAAVHRRLAIALAGSPEPSAAEVAAHWRDAEDTAQEVVWRVRAAREAGRRFAASQESEQWLRVLETWPDGADSVDDPPVRRPEVYLAAMDALEAAGQVQRALALADDALQQPGLGTSDLAELGLRAGTYRGFTEDAAAGLELIERSIEGYRRLPASQGLIRALERRAVMLRGLGRYDEGAASLVEAMSVDDDLGGTPIRRSLLASLAVQEMIHGRLDAAIRLLEEAAHTEPARPEPLRDLEIAAVHTAALLDAGRSAEEVEAAARRPLDEAREWAIGGWQTAITQGNVAEARVESGQVAWAAALIDPITDAPVTIDLFGPHKVRATLDLRRGLLEAARRRIEQIVTMAVIDVYNRADIVNVAVEVDLWSGRPHEAFDRLLTVLDEALDTDAAAYMSRSLMLAARAAADGADAGPASGQSTGRRELLLEQLHTLRRRARTDPLGADAVPALSVAAAASWNAELARLARAQTVELWATAVAEWDRLARPHESAYCRWRGALVARATGQATLADRLLRRAARDAREHAPLLEAIQATRGGAPTGAP